MFHLRPAYQKVATPLHILAVWGAASFSLVLAPLEYLLEVTWPASRHKLNGIRPFISSTNKYLLEHVKDVIMRTNHKIGAAYHENIDSTSDMFQFPSMKSHFGTSAFDGFLGLNSLCPFQLIWAWFCLTLMRCNHHLLFDIWDNSPDSALSNPVLVSQEL